METRRWVNPSQPATLAAATWFLYAGALVSLVVAVLDPSFLSLLAAALLVTAAYLTANTNSLGWFLGVFTCAGQVAVPAIALVEDFGDTISLWFVASLVLPIATLALLIHPESRDFQRVWFT